MNSLTFVGVVVSESKGGAFIIESLWGDKEICRLSKDLLDAPPRVGEDVEYRRGGTNGLGVITKVLPEKKQRNAL